jgi:hypothetical protein
MKAAELRIGNLVKYNGMVARVFSIESPEPIVNSHFSDKEIVILEIDGLVTATINQINPIPLTEEYLLNFGFEGCKSQNKDIQVGIVNDDFANNVMSFAWRGFILRKIQHVHQLQNLYHALTGEELTFKNTTND